MLLDKMDQNLRIYLCGAERRKQHIETELQNFTSTQREFVETQLKFEANELCLYVTEATRSTQWSDKKSESGRLLLCRPAHAALHLQG